MKKKFLSILLSAALCFGMVVTGGFHLETAQAVPNSPKVTASGYEKIKVSWTAGGEVSVYRATSKSGTYKRIATTTRKYYYDKSAEQNKTYYYKIKNHTGTSAVKSGKINTAVALSKVPKYSGKPYVTINDNIPKFRSKDLKKAPFEKYTNLDSLGRTRTAWALLDEDMMPDEERESIGMIKPSGWHTIRYDHLIEDKYLYNRCHLIGFQLTGQNANPKNLITGTRHMNINGMLPFENKIARYIRSTGNRVLYRATPIYDGKDLVATGVQLEARSVEDKGKGICFNVFVYNVQPGIDIDYYDGSSCRSKDSPSAGGSSSAGGSGSLSGIIAGGGTSANPSAPAGAPDSTYVMNTNTYKFHYLSCPSVDDMKDKNKAFSSDRDAIVAQGYSPCKRCNP